MLLVSQAHIQTYTEQGLWGTDTLDDLFRRNAAATPAAVALIDPPNRAELAGGPPQRFTYAELAAAVERLASGLLKLGLHKDDVLMVQLPNIVELPIVYLAAARLGLIVSPLPVQYRTHELRQTISVARPAAFITTNNFGGFNYVEMVQHLQAEAPSLKTLIALGTDLPSGVVALSELLTSPADVAALTAYAIAHPVDANEVFTICWTSGTEAEPKGVPRSHNHWISIAYATVDGAQIAPGDTLLNPFPMVNMSAIGGMLVPWLLTGGALVMHHPLNLGLFLAQIKTERVTYTVVPPVLLNMLLLNPAILANADLSSIKCIGSGSAPLSTWMTTSWKTTHGIDILNFFGSNEGTALLSAPAEIPDAGERARYFPRYGVPGFEWTNRGVRGMSTKLIDPITGEAITQANVAGELVIQGPTVFSGYYGRPDLTAKSFDADGYFHTGDLFEIAGEGGQLNRYQFVGRLKDLIIRGGMKIAPEEIEALLIEHPKVAEVAVVGIPDRRLDDERICAVVVAKKEQTVSIDELHDFLKTKDMAAYKMPKKLLIIEALPRNPVGKILKRELREKLATE